MSNSLSIKKKKLQSLLNSVTLVSDPFILNVEADKMTALVSTPDSRMILVAKLEDDFDYTGELNLPSSKKLSDALKMTSEEEVTFKVNHNNLEYKKGSIKFKYHLYDDGIITKPKYKISKLESLNYDVEFEISVEYFQSLLKSSSVFKSTNKMYLYTDDDGHLVWSLEDRDVTNSDVFSVVASKVDFEIETPFIMSLDNLKLINLKEFKEIFIKINVETGYGSFMLKNNDLTLNYTILTLVK